MPDSPQRIECLMQPPVQRAAYSDRTAWLMAVLASLSYIPFECSAPLEALSKQVATMDDPDSIASLIENWAADSTPPAKQRLLDELARFNCELIETFSVTIPFIADTQAFICRLQLEDEKPLVVLVFRGTEPKKLGDFVTNFNNTPKLIDAKNNIRVHGGFWDAFMAVEDDIAAVLQRPELIDLPLYISGHSLGGALAILAAYRFQQRKVGACYTYGSPRVGNARLGEFIKTPIYRHVNASDIVPRLPPWVLARGLMLILQFLPVSTWRNYLLAFLEKYFSMFRHCGDMRYLTHAAPVSSADKPQSLPQYPELRVLANPSQLSRFIWHVQRVMSNWKAGFEDHSIEHYLNKLAYWASCRNQ